MYNQMGNMIIKIILSIRQLEIDGNIHFSNGEILSVKKRNTLDIIEMETGKRRRVDTINFN